MFLVPTVVALYQAHKERLARINAAAIIEPVAPAAIVIDHEKIKRETDAALREQKRVVRELAAQKKRPTGKLIAERVTKDAPTPFFSELLFEVSRFYDIPTLSIKSARRDAPSVRARQVACYLAYKETGLSFPAIGRLLGNRDHTTILYAVRKMERLLKEGDENLAVAIITIKLRLKDRVQARFNILTAVA